MANVEAGSQLSTEKEFKKSKENVLGKNQFSDNIETNMFWSSLDILGGFREVPKSFKSVENLGGGGSFNCFKGLQKRSTNFKKLHTHSALQGL